MNFHLWEEKQVKIIIAGAGKVGIMLTKKLLAEGYEITIIDRNQKVLDAVTDRFDVIGVLGNAASMDTLNEASVKKADLLIAVAGEDEFNLLCCMTAHGINSGIHTIARIRNPEYSDQIYKMRDTFALSMTVNPERQAAVEIERLLKYPGFLRRDTFAKGRAEIVELKVKEGSKLCDVALNDLNNILKCKVLVCAVRRNGVVSAPDGNFVLKEGDHIFVTAAAGELTRLLKSLGIITHKVKRVILCGGGKVGFYLASILSKSGVDVELIEQNEERCVLLASQLPDVSVIHGDASNQLFLESEGIEQCDALVGLTSFDEMNMIISLYAKNYNVDQVITKVDHTENVAIQDALGLDSVICPKELCCNQIVRYVRAMENTTGAALTVHSFADGQMEALEFRVDEESLHCGEPLKNLSIRKNVLIACITRARQPIIPDGDTTFQKGDTVVVVASGDTVLHKFNDIFA